MLLIIYSILIGYMIFFTLCIAPIINSTLDRENASKLLRKVFPRNFLFGLVLSILAILVSFLLKQNTSLIIAIFLTCLFLLNLYYIMPKINTISDKDKKRKQQKYLNVSPYWSPIGLQLESESVATSAQKKIMERVASKCLVLPRKKGSRST